MGDIPEPRSKIWIGRSRKIQVSQFEPVELTAGIQSSFETIPTAMEITMWMKEMETVVTGSLDRQEQIERQRLIKTNEETVNAEKTGVKYPPAQEKSVEQRNLNNIKKSDTLTEKPTPRQIDFLRKHDIRYDGKTTKEQATKLISEEIASWKQ